MDDQVITLSILVAGAILAALAATLGLAGTVHLTSRRAQGYMHWIFYAMVWMVALTSLFSARDLSGNGLSFDAPAGRNPLLVLAQPLVSLLLLTVAGERIVTYWLRRDKTVSAPRVLLFFFILFWLGTVASPALLGAHPYLSHDYVYPLVIGIAAILSTGAERDRAFQAARNALLVFMVASLLLIPIKPNLVLETSYTQGLLPGVPRLVGLAAHAVSLGILAQLCLLCLLASPYRRVWLNRLAWVISLAVLFLAQSKTSWISFALSLVFILAVRQGPSFSRRVGDPVRPEFGILSILIFIFVVMGSTLVVMFGDLDARLSNFFNSTEGAQLASLTGRDKIWAIAYEEWQRNPVFGYGPTIWEEAFRKSIGMPNAMHAHNQFMDTLSRSGSVGAVALVLYALVLLILSVRYARASNGITLGLFVALAMRSTSEVPLSLFGYGTELVTHVLLLITLAASASDVRIRRVPVADIQTRQFPSRLRPARDPLINAGLRS
jgi:O-antigen ligase